MNNNSSKTKPKRYAPTKDKAMLNPVDPQSAPLAGQESFEMNFSTNSPSGLTIIVLSYERRESLAMLLESLLLQNLDGIDLELILCNNSSRIHFSKTRFSKIGRLLSKFQDIKIFNSSYDWHTKVRYAVATISQHDTVLFLDDDLLLLDSNFIRYMFKHFKSLGPFDMLSCWNTIWVDWTSDDFKTVSLNFNDPTITKLTQTDLCGMGICMFHKRILFHSIVEKMAQHAELIGDYAFPILAAMTWGTKPYFLPSYNMLAVHEENQKHSMCRKAGFYTAIVSVFRSLIENGYKPLISRDHFRFNDPTSPEAKVVKRIEAVPYPKD